MAQVRIEHTDAQGTLLADTARGDGSAQVVKGLGWRWGRSIGAWYVPRSRNVPPKRGLIETTAQALRAAGFEVQVDVDATPQERAEVEARLSEQADRRVEMLTWRADRHEQRAQQREAAADRAGARFEGGQPILVGHHSERAARRDARRMHDHIRATLDERDQRDEAVRAARAAAAHTSVRNSPITVANRIERLGAQLRKDERELAWCVEAGMMTDQGWALGVRERLEAARADLAHWQTVRSQQLADGRASDYGPASVKPGDEVNIRRRWRRVVRANPKTVSVETGYSWVDKAPWHEVLDHRPAQS